MKDVDINTVNRGGWAALHDAVYSGNGTNLVMVSFLIENGANVNAENRDKNTPLHFACVHGNIQLVKYLIKKGASVNAENVDGGTSLYLASQEGHFNVVKHLIENGACVNVKAHGHCTSLHVAVYKGRTSVVEYLLKRAPELISAQTVDGFTALDFAYEKRNEAVIKLFRKHGIYTTCEKQAEANMYAFFAELDQEAWQMQMVREQRNQKKLENKNLENRKIKNITNKNNGRIDTKEEPIVNDTIPSIVFDVPMESNSIATNSAQKTIIIPDNISIKNISNKSTTICSPVSCINKSVSSKSPIIITPKEQQSTIQISSKKPSQLSQINNEYQIGHDKNLKWPRSLDGTKYDLMREHLRQLKRWPETIGLDIKLLKGQSGMYRLRVGGYRVLFKVDQTIRRIIIHEIGLRKKVYRSLEH